jgi:uncharacterized damage-inducible protein DinB
MPAHASRLLTLFVFLAAAQPLLAQDAPADFRDEFLGQFNYSAQRMLALAEAMPAETFAWSPGEGVMSVEQVYMHIARYNYYYPESSLGIAAPEGVDVANMEEITGKDAVIGHLERSLDHVRDLVRKMPEEALSRSVRLYGRDVQAWAVLFQLQAHMNEHVGQSIAYARMNGVVPPWSR